MPQRHQPSKSERHYPAAPEEVILHYPTVVPFAFGLERWLPLRVLRSLVPDQILDLSVPAS